MATLRSLNEELYSAIVNDTRDSSPRFIAMRAAFMQLAEQELDEDDKLQETVARLSRLQDFANIYLSNHGGFRATEKGQQRATWAAQISQMTKELHDRKKKELFDGANEIKQFYERKTGEDPRDNESLAKLAKLQRCIGTADIVPRTRDFTLQPSLWQRFRNTVGRGLSHLFNFVFTITTSFAALIPVAPLTRTGRYEEIANETEIDMSLVPGTKTGERFEELHPENGSKDQEVCSDTRRVPINYEEAIPEDPNQPPTMTLCFEQGTEGSTVANDVHSENGHAFVSLKYTRTDPFTGQPTRYKCTFGFYPHQSLHSKRMELAQGATGLVIPGSLENDCDHVYDTAKTFTVDNRTINTVLMQAQQYAKGGYNYITRNCTTFAHDMTAAAGLPADDLFVSSDFEGGVANTLKGFSLLGTQTLSRLGKYAMMTHAGETVPRYERNGQKIINKDDVQRLSQRQFNARLEGYVPSVGAEAARNDWDAHLDSNKYRPDIPEFNAPDFKDKYSSWVIGKTRLEAEQLNLMASVEKFLKDNKVPEAERQEISDRLTAFMSTSDLLISNIAKTAFPKDHNWGAEQQPSQAQSIEATFAGTRAVNDYIEGLDQIFRMTFKADPGLNISFQHMASVLQKVNDAFAEKYRDLQGAMFRQNRMVNYYGNDVVRSYIDPTRDDYVIMARLKFTRSRVYSGKLQCKSEEQYNPEELAGIIKAFGSLEAFLIQEKEVFDAKNEFGEDSDRYTELNDKHQELCATAGCFARALKTMALKDSFNEHDVHFAFKELASDAGNIRILNNDANPTRIYQSLIITRICAGFRSHIEEGLAAIKENYMKQMEVLDAYKGLISRRDYATKLCDLKNSTQKQMGQLFYGFAAEKLKASPLFDTIVNDCKEAAYQFEKVDPGNARPEDLASPDNTAFNQLTSLIAEEMIKPVLIDIHKNIPVPENTVRNQAREDEFDDLLMDSVNPTKLEIDPGAAELVDVLRDKFVPKAIYSKDEAEALLKTSRKNFINDTLNGLRKELMPEDLAALDRFKADQKKTLADYARRGEASIKEPKVMDALSKVLVATILTTSVNKDSLGLQSPVTGEMISTEVEKLKAYGALEDLKDPRNKEIIDRAIKGSDKDAAELITKVSKRVKDITAQTKKELDARVSARETIRKEKEGRADEPAIRPAERRRSFSEKSRGLDGPGAND